MTARALLLLSALFLSFAASAQDVLNKALLWQIDDTDPATPSSYLFGTIHLIDAKDFLISDSLMMALNRVDAVTFEIDPAEMTDPMMAMQLITKAFMRGDTSLRDLMTPEAYSRVDAHFSEMGLPMMFLDKVKPMFLSMLAGADGMDFGAMMGGESNSDEEKGAIKSYELELDGIARDAEKQVAGLESTEFQLGLFDSIPYRAQADMLLQAIDNPGDEEVDQLAELTKIYMTGDIDGMYTMSTGGDSGLGGFEQMLIVNRNLNWVNPMKTQMAATPTLFAVGAGHLGGPQGVVRLLRAEGYKLTPLSIR